MPFAVVQSPTANVWVQSEPGTTLLERVQTAERVPWSSAVHSTHTELWPPNSQLAVAAYRSSGRLWRALHGEQLVPIHPSRHHHHAGEDGEKQHRAEDQGCLFHLKQDVERAIQRCETSTERQARGPP